MITPRAVVGLIVGALGMPIGMCVLFALSRLLDAMKDESGSARLGTGEPGFVCPVADRSGGAGDCDRGKFTAESATDAERRIAKGRR